MVFVSGPSDDERHPPRRVDLLGYEAPYGDLYLSTDRDDDGRWMVSNTYVDLRDVE